GSRRTRLCPYMDFSLSEINVSEIQGGPPKETTYNETKCRYRGYYTDSDAKIPYVYTQVYWEILAMKLVFVLLYEHVIYLIKFALAYMVPDVPDFVRDQIRRENYLSQKALHDAAFNKAKSESSNV
ncbi:anoctamin, partial [Salmonella sp. s55004]|uniref:anoctamin n=1 Tax=Salmonella sp. s55004 TaxID=3159675 RepID=UPI00397F0E0F